MAYTTIDDPSAHFQTKLYTGNSTNNTAITNDGNSDLQPDWIWAKSRTNTHYHDLRDSTRGVTKRLVSNTNDAESTKDQSYVSFDSDGFTLGDDTDSGGSALNTINTSSNNYVAWQWKANGGTTSTDTNGAVNSTVQANTTAGFSIVTWTSAGSTNVGHGLGVAPNLIIIKARNAAENWLVGSDEIVWTKRIRLNTTDASANSSAFGQAPTSSIFYCSPANASYNYVAYCFAEKQGYSKFGSYTGNGNADGPFVYTGFKPAWLMLRNTVDGEDWLIWDVKRDIANSTGNPMTGRLKANDTIAEVNGNDIDFLSNGFKIRTDSGYANGNGNTIIYMAFAEHPFVSSKGVPTTAR